MSRSPREAVVVVSKEMTFEPSDLYNLSVPHGDEAALNCLNVVKMKSMYCSVTDNCKFCNGIASRIQSRLGVDQPITDCPYCNGHGGDFENGPAHTTHWRSCEHCMSTGVVKKYPLPVPVPVAAPAFDPVAKPSHYNQGKMQPIDAIPDATIGLGGYEGFLVGNIIKYIWRWKHKNGLEDLKKVRWYLDRLIEKVTADGGK